MRETARFTIVVGDLKGIQAFNPIGQNKLWKHTFEK
jgi:hypothetical protein